VDREEIHSIPVVMTVVVGEDGPSIDLTAKMLKGGDIEGQGCILRVYRGFS
jgi:hypothetical protein